MHCVFSSFGLNLLVGFLLHGVVILNNGIVLGEIYCPEISAPEGVQLQCLFRDGRSKVENKASVVTDDCSLLRASPMTLAQFRCKPHYTSTVPEDTGGVIKCNRKGKWRHAKRLRKFSCHLHTEGWIEKLIEENKVVIFGKSYCSYCKKIKQLFTSLGERYHVVEVDYLDEKKAGLLKEALFKKTGMTTWPNVFVTQNHVGGYDDTVYAQQDGILQQLLSL